MRALLAGLTLAAVAAPPAAIAQRAATIELMVGEGRLIRLPGAAESAAIARPEVADAQVPSPTQLYVFGKAPGRSGVTALGAGGRVLANYDVLVAPDLTRLGAFLAGAGGGTARASHVGGAVVLEGTVATPAEAETADAMARAAAGGKPENVINRLKVTLPTQVNLRVRVAEVSRTLARELGFNFDILGEVGGFALGITQGRMAVDAAGSILRSITGANSAVVTRRTSSLDFNAVIDALEQDGLVTVLAEPNLTARSGETASFLSGGEFPIPVDQDDNNGITIEFKQFGVSLDFTPTVLSGGRISLKVRPEVSELNDNAGIELDNIRVPGLSVRRADTTVELASGQSFAIAGLLQASSANSVRATPFLSRIPILGALFRSTRFQRNETELVIMVTPYLVEPAPGPDAVRLPTDAVVPAVSFDSLFRGRIAARTVPPAGDTGFIVE